MRKLVLLWSLLLLAMMTMGQQKVTVEAQSYEVSDNLDLEAVAVLFGQSKNIEDFEKQLNNPEKRLSNLDLNNDGYVDFLRVVEVEENRDHIVLIQAVIGEDLFQDVATIVVEGESKKSATVTVVGNSNIYGNNYVIRPVYVVRPIIFDWFWAPRYVAYHSLYYWDYYPSYYTVYDCMGYHSYYRHIHSWHSHYHGYCDFYRPAHYTYNFINVNIYNDISRNDYADYRPNEGYRENPTPNKHLTINNSSNRRHLGSVSTANRNGERLQHSDVRKEGLDVSKSSNGSISDRKPHKNITKSSGVTTSTTLQKRPSGTKVTGTTGSTSARRPSTTVTKMTGVSTSTTLQKRPSGTKVTTSTTESTSARRPSTTVTKMTGVSTSTTLQKRPSGTKVTTSTTRSSSTRRPSSTVTQTTTTRTPNTTVRRTGSVNVTKSTTNRTTTIRPNTTTRRPTNSGVTRSSTTRTSRPSTTRVTSTQRTTKSTPIRSTNTTNRVRRR